MRVVLDTSTLVSAVLWDGLPQKVYQSARLDHITLLSSPPLIQELEIVLRRAKFVRAFAAANTSAEAVLAEYRDIVEWVTPGDVPTDAVRDPKDVIVLACAVGGQADYIVSGDRDLLDLQQYQTVSIITAAEYVQLLD
jgi:putative PIN family toxin of toxin-antitoxin system